jgi:hypothetical protein
VLLKIRDNVTVAVYTAENSMDVIREAFEGRAVSKGLWIIRASDFSNFLFRGT